jgi:hypothetical protein
MGLMTTDLREPCQLDKNFAFLGMHRALGLADADNIDFATHHFTPKREHEADYCEISYFAQKNPATGKLTLWRRRNPTLSLNPLSGGHREELVAGLEGVRLEYTDGLDWYTDWGQTNNEKQAGLLAEAATNLKGMPEAVRITLSFADTTPLQTNSETGTPPGQPLVFQTVVRLELVDAGSLPVASAAASGSASTSAANSSQGMRQGPPGSLPNGGNEQ